MVRARPGNSNPKLQNPGTSQTFSRHKITALAAVLPSAAVSLLLTWLPGVAVIADVQVQAGDEQVVGGFLHVVLVKVLPDAAGIGAGSKGLGPGLLGTGSRGGDLCERDKLSENSERGKIQRLEHN